MLVDWVGALGSLLGAFGTIAACCIALHLAYSSRRVVLKVDAGLGATEDHALMIRVVVTNAGMRAATIASLEWRAVVDALGGAKVFSPIEIHSAGRLSSKLPQHMAPGESAIYLIDPDESDRAKAFYGAEEGSFASDDVRLLVTTADGYVVSVDALGAATRKWGNFTRRWRRTHDR